MQENDLNEYRKPSEDTEEATPRKFSVMAAITVTQTVCVAVIVLTLIALRLICPSLFAKIGKSYISRFTAETSVSEVLGYESGEDSGEI